MKQLKRTALVLLFLTFSCIAGIAQNSENSIQTNDSQTASSPAPLTREQAIAKLIEEVKAGRATIEELKERVTSLEAQIAAEKANSESLQKSYSDAERQIDSLQKAISALERATQLHEQTIALLKDENTRLKKERNTARKQLAIVIVAAVGKEVLRLLF